MHLPRQLTILLGGIAPGSVSAVQWFQDRDMRWGPGGRQEGEHALPSRRGRQEILSGDTRTSVETQDEEKVSRANQVD